MRIVLHCGRCPAELGLPGDDDELLADLADDAGWLQLGATGASTVRRWVCADCVTAVLPCADEPLGPKWGEDYQARYPQQRPAGR